MPRQIFKNRVIAAAGPLPGQLTPENLKRWTEIRKGCFSEHLDETVTHLLCSREQFNKRVPAVKKALKRGKRFHIVHYDWFEFSTVNEKRESEREYPMRNILAKQNARRREEARIEKGIRDGEKFVNTNLFHIYIDRELFSYQIDITRDDEEAGEQGQRYTLCLWESDAKPHLYWFTAKFLKKKGDSQPRYHRPSACSGKWRVEMQHFMDFFRLKTGIDWEDRVIKEGTMSATNFQYSPPTGGKPVGRRMRFDYDYCREVNAELRGLPWPPPEPVTTVEQTDEFKEPETGECDQNDEPMDEDTSIGANDAFGVTEGDNGKNSSKASEDVSTELAMDHDDTDAETEDGTTCASDTQPSSVTSFSVTDIDFEDEDDAHQRMDIDAESACSGE